MKFNKWTLGLAAVGVVSLASAVRADDATTANTVLTSLSSTTISGYVDTSAQWNFGTGNANPPPVKFNNGKQDGFNLDVVQLTIAKPMDESEWAAGYRVDLWMGPDANTLGTQSLGVPGDLAVRQAYVSLRMPIGNGLDWKVGVFDSIIGYESVAGPSNPNYTRSYGHSIEPQTMTGILATYHFSEHVSVSGGVANTIGPMINARAFNTPTDGDPGQAESSKTYMAALSLTAPDSWGFLSGSTLYGGFVNGLNSNDGATSANDFDENSTSYYAGLTMATPITNLKLGSSFDLLNVHDLSGETWAIAGYASFQATEKLSLHVRGEYLRDRGDQQFFTEPATGAPFSTRVFEVTTTIQYDLWKNVLSRLEFRWDHSADGTDAFGGKGDAGPTLHNAYMLAANIIYKF
jgi:hypothetical protein